MGCNQSTEGGSAGRESKANVDEQTYMLLDSGYAQFNWRLGIPSVWTLFI